MGRGKQNSVTAKLLPEYLFVKKLMYIYIIYIYICTHIHILVYEFIYIYMGVCVCVSSLNVRKMKYFSFLSTDI